jgi:hypothetical protein
MQILLLFKSNLTLNVAVLKMRDNFQLVIKN